MDSKKYNSITECVVDAQNGVDGAFDTLYSMSYPYAYSAASHLLKSHEDIEDALQNSFYYVSKNISGLREPAAYLKWLNTIVINECKKVLLEHNKHSKIFFAEKNRLMLAENSHIIDDNLIEKSDLIETISKMIDDMNPKKSEVLKLYYFENLSYSEISERLGIPIGTVMSRLHNAKHELEKKVKDLQKGGTVLWSLPILPLIAALLSYNVKADIPSAVIGKSIGTVGAATTASASGSISTAGTTATIASVGASSAGTATAMAGTSVAVKAAAIVVAATVAVGGGVATKKVLENRTPASTTAMAENINIDETEYDFMQSTELKEPSNTTSETDTSGLEARTDIEINDMASSEQKSQNSSSDFYNNSEPVTTSNIQTTKEERTRRSSATTTTKTTTTSSTTQPSSHNNNQTEATKPTTVSTTTTTQRETTTYLETSTEKESTTDNPSAGFSASGGVINGYSGSGGAVTIPSTVNGENVTAIGTRAFEGSDITSVSIPSGVTRIGQMSFSDCNNLSSVSLPSTLTSIGDCAFDGCSSLNTINIPNSVTNIGDDAFDGCDNLTIRCSEGSVAYDYAVENGINYELI